MCPVCTVTVIAGLGLSRLLGIHDLITSIWIGGFILSLSFITTNWLEKSKWRKKIYSFLSKFKYKMTESQILGSVVIILMYSLVIIPFLMNHTIGIRGNSILGIDKILLGIVVGSLVFLLGIWFDKKMRKIYGHQFIKFQKVVFPVLSLIIASVVFYLITK